MNFVAVRDFALLCSQGVREYRIRQRADCMSRLPENQSRNEVCLWLEAEQQLAENDLPIKYAMVVKEALGALLDIQQCYIYDYTRLPRGDLGLRLRHVIFRTTGIDIGNPDYPDFPRNVVLLIRALSCAGAKREEIERLQAETE
jgi:hypothetical protein